MPRTNDMESFMTIQKIAEFLKERDDAPEPGEATDVERQESAKIIAALYAQPDAGSGGDARFYAHPSGDGSICRSGSTTRLCLDELLAALNSVAARQPVGVEPRTDLVPGVVRCAKCAFQLHCTNLYMGSGTVGPGDSKTEPCPNGCGPLWPVTWETWAREGWAEAERLHMEQKAAPPAPADRMAIKMLVAAGFVSEDKANESLRIAHGFGGDLGRPAPAAVQTDFVKVATWDQESANGFQWLPGFTRSSFPTGAGVFIGQPPAPAAVPVGLQDIIGSMLNYAGVADTCEVTQGHAPVAIRNWAEMLQELAWPVAVPVDGLRDAERIDAIAREYWRLDPIEIPTGAGDADVGWRVSQFLMPNRIQFVAEVFVDDPRQAIDAAMRATHPQPAAAELGNRTGSKLEQELQKLESKLGLKREQSAPWTAKQKAECKAAMQRIREREAGKPEVGNG